VTTFENLRIIFFTHYSGLYGANRSLLDLITGLQKLGLRNVLLIAPRYGAVLEEAGQKQIPFRVIRFANEMHNISGRESWIKKVIKRIYNHVIVFMYATSLKKNCTQLIIHSNTSVTLIGAYFSNWLKVPHIWHIREFGKEDYDLEYNFGHAYFQRWLNKSAAIIAISNAVFEKRVACSHAPLKKVVYNGVVAGEELLERRRFAKIKDAQKNSLFTFGIIGFISKAKNQSEAIEAFHLLYQHEKGIQLIIAGDHEDAEYHAILKETIAGYHLENSVSFMGHLRNTADFYTQANCLLMCSRHEAFGRVTAEAMSYGIPVIGFANAGTAEIIQHGYNGLLYREGQKDLFEKMMLLIKDNTLQNQIRQNALSTVKNNFTIEMYAQRIADVYMQLPGELS